MTATTTERTGLISNVIRRTLDIECAVLMGANVAREVSIECFCEATIGLFLHSLFFFLHCATVNHMSVHDWCYMQMTVSLIYFLAHILRTFRIRKISYLVKYFGNDPHFQNISMLKILGKFL